MARKVEYIEQIDRYVGAKIQELRLAHGMSRQELADLIEVTHQQLQKYEIGTNRVSAGRLALLAKYLNTSVEKFYDGLDSMLNAVVTEDAVDVSQNQRMCIEVSRNFMRIKNPEHKDAINALVRILARSEGTAAEAALIAATKSVEAA